MVTLTDPEVMGQGRLLVRVDESHLATCVFRPPDEFWPEREDELTDLHVLWTDDTRLFHGVIRRPDPDSLRIADRLSQEVWAIGLRLPTH